MTLASEARPHARPSFKTTDRHRARGLRLESVLLCACLLAAGCATRAPPPPSIPHVQLSEAQSEEIAIHAMGLVGTPYRYGGNTPEGGFDCSGLIGYVYRGSVGAAPPRTVAALSRFGQPVGASELRVGDLVLFGGNPPSHAGIYVGDNRFVHAPSTGGEVRLDRLDGIYWSRQRLEVRRP